MAHFNKRSGNGNFWKTIGLINCVKKLMAHQEEAALPIDHIF